MPPKKAPKKKKMTLLKQKQSQKQSVVINLGDIKQVRRRKAKPTPKPNEIILTRTISHQAPPMMPHIAHQPVQELKIDNPQQSFVALQRDASILRQQQNEELLRHQMPPPVGHLGQTIKSPPAKRGPNKPQELKLVDDIQSAQKRAFLLDQQRQRNEVLQSKGLLPVAEAVSDSDTSDYEAVVRKK